MKKLFIPLILVLASIYQVSSQTATISAWKGNTKGAYSIIHDDYGSTVVDGIWQYADTIAASRDIKFTIGAISGSCEESRKVKGYNTPYGYAKEVMMAEHGHEIISHSHTHSCAVGGSWSPCNLDQGWGETGDFSEEIVGCTESIEKGTGHKPQYYIYPYDKFTNLANDKLKELGYIGSRTGWTSHIGEEYHRNGYNANDEELFYPDIDGFFRTAVQVFDNEDTKKPDHAKILNSVIDSAIARSEWGNRELHNVGDDGWGTVSLEGYTQHLDYVQQKVASGDLWVGTISEVLTYQIQKLKYEAQISETTDLTWEVSWNSINPDHNIDVATYLSDLSYTSPLTLMVDLDGRTGDWLITQNGSNVPYKVKDRTFYIDVYPHQGAIKLELKNETTPAPVAINTIEDIKRPADFLTFSIDLNHTFEDENSRDEDLVYSVSGNENIDITIENGIVTISSQFDWEGEEMITFSATDESGQSTNEEVNFVVNGRNEPYSGSPIEIPAKIEAEDFDLGGSEVSFHEKDAEDNTTYRDEEVDIIENNGFTVSMLNNEWMEYTINISKTGYFDFDIYSNSDKEQNSIDVYVDNDYLKTFNIKHTKDEFTIESNKIYNITLDEGKHIIRLLAQGDLDLDYFEINEPGENSLPEVVTTIGDQQLFPEFATYTINLYEIFEDVETEDSELTFTATGNTEISIELDGGIATISSTSSIETVEDIIFTATDFSDGATDLTVKFDISKDYARPNESVNDDEGYIFTFDQTEEQNCKGDQIIIVDGGKNAYSFESVGGGEMTVTTSGTQYGSDNVLLKLNNGCEPVTIDLSHPNKRVMEIKIHSTVDVPEFLALLGDKNGILADKDIQLPSLTAGEWHTITFDYGSMNTWSGAVMDPSIISELRLYFRKDYKNVAQGVAGTFTIDYVKIGGELVPCPNPSVSYQKFINREKLAGFDTGKDAEFNLNTLGSNLSFQWFKDEEALTDNDMFEGTTSSNLVIKDFQESDLGSYYCEVSEACGVTVKSPTKEVILGDLNVPYSGSPINVPGRIEAEHYDLGGEGVAHHDANADNDWGNVIREEGVDVMSLPNGFALTSVWNSEWVEYTINVAASDYYDIDVRAATWNNVERFVQLSLDGDSLSYVPIVNTLNLDIYTTSSVKKVWIPEGEHVLRARFYRSIRFDYLDIVVGGNPEVVSNVTNQNEMQGFEKIEINLYDIFEDDKTPDESLNFQVSGASYLMADVTNGIITITADETFSGTETLTISAEDEEGKTTSIDVNVKITVPQGLSDNLSNHQFSIYPNPASTVLNIETNYSNEEIQLFNSLGVELARYNNVQTIDISNLPQGVYILRQGNTNKNFIKN